MRSSIRRAVSELAKDLGNDAMPKCVQSAAGSENTKSKRVKPFKAEVLPAWADACNNSGLPKLEKPSIKMAESRQESDRRGTIKPDCANPTIEADEPVLSLPTLNVKMSEHANPCVDGREPV